MYATIADLRAEAVTTGMASDARLTALLARATRFIDDLTGQWFEPRTKTLTLNGNGSAILHLPAPPISLTSVTISGSPLDVTQLTLCGKPGDEQRDNPKLLRPEVGEFASMGDVGWSMDPYTGPSLPLEVPRLRWTRGRQNIVIVGNFGYVEDDAVSPPPEIHDVCMRLVIRNLPLLTDPADQDARQRSEIDGEKTDGHSYTLTKSWRTQGFTGDQSIDPVLMRYRRPSGGGLV